MPVFILVTPYSVGFSWTLLRADSKYEATEGPKADGKRVISSATLGLPDATVAAYAADSLSGTHKLSFYASVIDAALEKYLTP